MEHVWFDQSDSASTGTEDGLLIVRSSLFARLGGPDADAGSAVQLFSQDSDLVEGNTFAPHLPVVVGIESGSLRSNIFWTDTLLAEGARYRKLKRPFPAPYRAVNVGSRIGLPVLRASLKDVPVA